MSRTQFVAVYVLLLALVSSACGGAAAQPSPPAAGGEATQSVARAEPTAPAGDAEPPAESTAAGAAAEPAATEATAPTAQPEATEAVVATAEPTKRPAASTKPRPPRQAARRMYVASDDYVEVNLRAKPSTGSRILAAVPYRAEVRAAGRPVRGRGGEWYAVEVGSKKGYISAGLLSAERPKPQPPGVRGTVVDAESGKPVARARVFLGPAVAVTDERGRYRLSRPAGREDLVAMAPGYAKFAERAARVKNGAVRLEPFEARGVYLPYAAATDAGAVDGIFDLIDQTSLNAVVVDVKADEGFVWDSRVPLARKVGAARPERDLAAFTRQAHKRGIYVIGRFTVFKDTAFAEGRPDLAIRSTGGGLWRDDTENAYTDPFQTEAWEYYGDLVAEMASKGLDEIQYDYVRFPVDGDLETARYREESTPESRVEQITEFLRYMDQRVLPMRIYSSADIFGLTAWHNTENGLGQVLERIAEHVDYVSPMLYPSGFNAGSGGYDNPAANSYGLIKQSMQKANARLRGKRALNRPFLQAFQDYAFDVDYGVEEHIEQRRAADELGSAGWLYWNPAAEYQAAAFR